MAATAAAATLSWGRPQPLHVLPASAPNDDLAGLTALACRSLRSCAAVGDFGYDLHTEPSTSVTQGEALNESAGVWGRARQIRLPANAASVGNQQAVLKAVACPAAGSCVAVGDYNDRAGVSEAMVVTESAGTWGQAREIAVPSTGGGELDSVSCPAPGACAAVGYYGDGSSEAYPLAVSESGGTWGAARQVIVPANDSAPGADGLSSVSCPAPGACTAVGYAGGSQGSNASASEMIAAGESGGVWGRAQTIALSPTLRDEPGPQDELYGVACAAARSCVAVGQFQSFPPSTSFGVEQPSAAGAHDSDLSQTSDAIVATESDGTWGVATRITPAARRRERAGHGARLGLVPAAARVRRGRAVRRARGQRARHVGPGVRRPVGSGGEGDAAGGQPLRAQRGRRVPGPRLADLPGPRTV